MARFFQIACLAALAVVTIAQDAAFQQGLSVHNQQLQEHIRKEQEQQRQVQQFSAALPQQQQYQPQPQYQQPQQQYQQIPQYNQYQGPPQTDDGQYNAAYYENPANFANNAPQQRAPQPQPQPQQEYYAGIQAHQAAIQEHLRKEGSLAQTFNAPQNNIDPAYQQGLAVHQRQIQEHLAKEQQGPHAQVYQHQQPQQHQNFFNNFGPRQ